MHDVTQILAGIEAGDARAADELPPLVYHERRRLADARMAVERSDHTLQSAALVHEAYLRLVSREGSCRWENRRHFFAAAAEAMRRILVEHARCKLGKQRGGDRRRVELNDAADRRAGSPERIIQLSEALEKPAEVDPTASQFIKLRFFGGMSVVEAAQLLGISRVTAYAHWTYAKATLGRSLG